MPDQTRRDWMPSEPRSTGVLVLISERADVPRLLEFTSQFASETFNIADEDLTKFYFSQVPYFFVTEYSDRLAAYSFAWIPETQSNLFRGVCGGGDCTASRECVQPGCLCKQGFISRQWRCR